MSDAPAAVGTVERSSLEARAKTRFQAVAEVSDRFFEDHVDAVALACRDMAGRFRRGGRLLAAGAGAAATDAWHVSVEFTHPVLVGKQALPAVALVDAPERQAGLLARPSDILLAIDHGGGAVEVSRTLSLARSRGLLTLALLGGTAPPSWSADHVLTVPTEDPTVVQEVQETLYHVLWELTHLFLEQDAFEQEEAP